MARVLIAGSEKHKQGVRVSLLQDTCRLTPSLPNTSFAAENALIIYVSFLLLIKIIPTACLVQDNIYRESTKATWHLAHAFLISSTWSLVIDSGSHYQWGIPVQDRKTPVISSLVNQ